MITREQALKLFKKYNKSESLYHHALSVEAVMREYAALFGENVEYWGIVGLLHDIDWEMFPEEHCKKAPELLKEIDAPDDMIRSICSHGYGLTVEIKPELKMEKILFTIDELTGLVNATALMRPDKIKGMEVKSVKKKWKDKRFAAGVNRSIIEEGARMAEIEIEEAIRVTITAMAKIADQIGLA